MRSFSIYSILLLCLLILVIDVLAFFWLQSITQLFPSMAFRTAINIAFWFFTIGLITSIIILKVRLDKIHPQRKHLLVTSLYGLAVSSFIPKFMRRYQYIISLSKGGYILLTKDQTFSSNTRLSK